MSGSQLIEESGRGKLVTKNLIKIRERKARHKKSNKIQGEKSSSHSESQVLSSPVHTSMDLDVWSCYLQKLFNSLSQCSQLYNYFKDRGELDRLKGNLMIY